jgi:hypothetical protein
VVVSPPQATSSAVAARVAAAAAQVGLKVIRVLRSDRQAGYNFGVSPKGGDLKSHARAF